MREILLQNSQSQRTSPRPGIMPQGPVERTSTLGEFKTLWVWMQMRTSPRSDGTRIRVDHPLGMIGVESNDQSQQLTLGVSPPTSDAGADRSNLLGIDALHHQR